MKKGFPIKNYVDKYAKLIHSRNNKKVPFHRWYPFVEGYSGELMDSILQELNYQPRCCLDPFAGSGTTPLVCQERGLKCISFEVNPFLFDLTKVKLRRDYDYETISHLVGTMEQKLGLYKCRWQYPDIETRTLFEREGFKKWVLNKEVVWGILDILEEIRNTVTESKYRDLFKIALASILLKVSNVFRNGKCLSYKKNWQKQRISREEVHNKFIETCKDIFLDDLSSIKRSDVDNLKFCMKGDARKIIDTLEDESADLVITSPPYLNSRDYTDIYRVELWLLGYLKTFAEERELRKSSIRSHVQINWEKEPILEIPSLKKALGEILKSSKDLWNPNIPQMLNGYFVDMNNILRILYRKLKVGARVYLIVGNSVYGGFPIKVDRIIAEISERLGYKVLEIRIGRYTKTSGQQKSKRTRESVVVLEK